MIIVEQLSKKYGTKTVFSAINIQFNKGMVYGIVGENGAGKSTLFRCISGMESYEGKITSSLNPLKNYTGLLLTEPYFMPKITAKEYLHWMCLSRNKSIPVWDKINIFDLPLNQYAEKYSSGMKKKLALLGVLLQQNELYILDEPFNGVDLQSNLLITDIILQLKQKGKTVLISSHIFSTLKETCDEIYVLKNGSLSSKITKDHFNDLEESMKNETKKYSLDEISLG